MICIGVITDDDDDVDVETIPDTPWSVEMPRDMIQNVSSTRRPLLTKPLNHLLSMEPKEAIPNPIANSHRIQGRPSGKSGKISISQASENSAARCRVTLGQKPQLLPDTKLSKVLIPPKCTAVLNSVKCHSSASVSATTTDRSKVLARCTYIRNPAVQAIDKKGSYPYYLHMKIKQLISIIASYARNLDREIQLMDFFIDLYFPEIKDEIEMLKSKVGSNADDFDSKLNLLGSKMESYDRDLFHRSQLLLSKMNSYARDLHKKITSLNAKIVSYAHDLGMQITLLNSKINLFGDDVFKKFCAMLFRLISHKLHYECEFEELKSETV